MCWGGRLGASSNRRRLSLTKGPYNSAPHAVSLLQPPLQHGEMGDEEKERRGDAPSRMREEEKKGASLLFPTENEQRIFIWGKRSQSVSSDIGGIKKQSDLFG